MRLTRAINVFSLAAVLLSFSTVAGSTTAPPLTLSELSVVVQASGQIASVPDLLTIPLSQVGHDTPATVLPGIASCTNPTKWCFYGNTRSKKTILLTGDSHAFMWAPPLARVASGFGYRLAITWLPGCPSTVVTQSSCTTFKAKVDAAVATQRPAVVLLAERTATLTAQPTWPTSDDVWATGLAGRLLRLERSSKVAMVLDTPAMPASPARCLAIDPHQVQRCGTPLPPVNPLLQARSEAERRATTFAHATAIDPLPWLCGGSCAPILGNTVAYYDQTHLATSWAMQLTTVLHDQIAPLVR